MSRMEDCLEREVLARRSELGTESVLTLYFGGGTPSLMRAEFITKMIRLIFAGTPDAQRAEITLEVNPDDVTYQSATMWKDAGVNRISIGVQSFEDTYLQWMKRPHNGRRAVEAIEILQQVGFENITMDLIYGIPGLSMKVWKEQMDTFLSFSLPHLSAYCLTAEQRTLYGTQVEKGVAPAVNQDDASDQYLLLVQVLESAGYNQYEVSNFSKPGMESRHNSSYWLGKNYMGIGPSAHSFNGWSRRWNVSNNHLYMRALESGGSGFACSHPESRTIPESSSHCSAVSAVRQRVERLRASTPPPTANSPPSTV